MLINVDALFSDGYSFPWEMIDMYRPKAGGAHSYICEAVAKYADTPDERLLLSTKPALFELRRAAKHSHLIEKIVTFCEDEYHQRGNVADQVVNFLWRFEPLRTELSKIIDRKFLEGLISVPSSYLTPSGEEWLRPKRRE